MDCGYTDVQELQVIERDLLYGFAAACLERSAGDIFNRPLSVASNVKEELIYKMQHDEVQSYEKQAPSETIKIMLDTFVLSKRNFLGKVRSGLSSKQNMSKVEEMVRDVERNNVWPTGQRETLAKMLLKRVDITGTSHCMEKFENPEELAGHMNECRFRPVNCQNPGCNEVLSALYIVGHDSGCDYKLLPCKLKCDSLVRRGDMDKHCSSICPMKPVNCEFFNHGCFKVVPQCELQRHLEECVSGHLLLVLRSVDKHEGLISRHGQQVSLLEKAVSLSQRSEAVDVGSLSLTVKEQDHKIKILEAEVKKLRTELKKTLTDAAKLTTEASKGKVAM